MLNTHRDGLSETQMLDRIKAARAEPEPEQGQPESEEPVTLQNEEVVEETVEAEPEQEEVVYEEAESAEESQDEGNEEAEDSVYLIGDKEISLKRIEELEQSEFRQSDYTKKTTELSEQRKALEADSLATKQLHGELSDSIKALSESIDSEVESVNWDELAEDDPTEYLKRQRALDKKSKVLKEAQEKEGVLLQQKAADEVNLLASKMPSWAGEKGESNRKKDSDLAIKALSDLGYTDQDLSANIDHRFYMLAIKAAKYDALKSKAPAITKKVAQAPKVTPTTKTAQRKVTKAQEARQRLRKTGSESDALAAIKSLYKGN